MNKVTILCHNDFPVMVFVTEERAEKIKQEMNDREAAKAKAGERRGYYHTCTLEVQS